MSEENAEVVVAAYTCDEFTAQPVELVDAGENQVVAVVQISGRAKFSGVETAMTFAAI